MKIWYYDLPEGDYTMQEIMQLCKMKKDQYQCVYHTLRRFKVKSFYAELKTKNEKVWKWKGAEYYLTRKTNK